MFLYVAAICAMVGGASADSFENARHFHKVDVKGIAKYAKEHGLEKSAHRNLRDEIKPHDTVYEMFRDSSCSIPMFDAVDHGNTLYKDVDEQDGTVSHVKIGCVEGPGGSLFHNFVNYGNSDGSGQPEFGPHLVPFFGVIPGINAGQCVQMPSDDPSDVQFAKIHCSAKDPFRDAQGFHMLNFEDQLKECHDFSLKTNRAKAHNFIAPNKCISMDSGKSMMATFDSCGNGEVRYREDPNSETCENLGPEQVHKFGGRCREETDNDGNVRGVSRELCVDANTPPQQ